MRENQIFTKSICANVVFYTTLLKQSKGMHTNKLWYVNKTTFFLSRSFYVHVVEQVYHFDLSTFKQQYMLT